MLDKSILANLEQIKKSCLVVDLECSSTYPDGREVNISADFENYKKFAKVKWVGLYSYLYDKTYLLNAQQDAQDIMKLLQEHNTLIGFNSEEFDFPILVNNVYIDIEKKYLQVDIMQIYGTSNFKNKSGYAYKNRAILMDYKLKNNSLRCMAETMGVENLKGDIDYKIFIKNQWTSEEEKEIKTYLQSDVLATKQLFEMLWNYWLPFAELLDVKDIYNLSWIRSSIASLTYKAACRVINTEPTYAEKGTEAEEKGGNVYLPKYEESRGVWYVDVGSLYPHMFAMANLPAEVELDKVLNDIGVAEEHELDLSQSEKYWHGNEIFQVKGYYKKDKWHPLSQYIASKLKERIALKESDKTNPMVYTLKIFLNGLYGIFRSPIFEKIHTPNCGWDCCWLGQQVQALMKEMLEQFGFEIIQGDTDSLFFIANEGTDNSKEYVQDCLKQIAEVIKDNFPFPVGTFKIGIEHYLDYLMVPFDDQPIEGEDGKNLKKGNRLILERQPKKKNYVMVYKDKDEVVVDLVGLPIKKDNASALGMRIYDDVLKPEIIKNMRAKFPASYIQNIINDYLKKPSILELVAVEYKVKSADSYKNNAIQKQISQAYFNGQDGIVKLIKNSKVGRVGQGTKYATIQEAIDAKLTSEELDLEKVNQELSPFVEYSEPEIDVINIETKVEATVSKEEYEACKEVLEPIKSENKNLDKFLNKIICGDCLEVMKEIPDQSIDMILCDLPYGTTASNWDKIIDSNKMWKQYERIIKDNGAIVLFASGQFTYKLIQSNENLYRYKWVWFKSKRGNFVNAKNRPMTAYEEILIFSKGVTANGCVNKMNYYPQGLESIHKINIDNGTRFGTMAGKRPSHQKETIQEFTNYPFDVLQFDSVGKPIHPTEKPIRLCEYVIKTYTKEGDVVLDNCCGSGTTGVSCKNTNRNFIQIEQNPEYVKIAEERLKNSDQSLPQASKPPLEAPTTSDLGQSEVLLIKKRGRPKKEKK